MVLSQITLDFCKGMAVSAHLCCIVMALTTAASACKLHPVSAVAIQAATNSTLQNVVTAKHVA